MSAAENFGGNEKNNNKTENAGEPRFVKLGGSTVGGKVDFNASAGQGGFDKAFTEKFADAKTERAKVGAMEVAVDHNIEKAMRVLKRKLIKEGLFKELKARRYFEKPSVRRKRKEKESAKKVRKEEARARKNPMLIA